MIDPDTRHCAIIDSVMDIDYAAGRITHDHADELIAEVRERGLTLDWIIETHVHADHLSAAPYIQQHLGGKIGVGGGKTREDFIKFRTERDAQLAMPTLIIPALQVNMRGGEVPTDKNGHPVLKVPVNGL